MRKSLVSFAIAALMALCGLSLTACQSTNASAGVSAANSTTQPSEQVAAGYRHNIGNGAFGEDVP